MALRYSYSLMNVDYVQLNHKWNYKNVVSPFYRLYLIDGGDGTLSTAAEEVFLEEGFLYLIPSFTAFNQRCDRFLSQYYIHFVEESPDGSSLFSSRRRPLKVKAGQTDLVCLKRIHELNPGRDLRQSDNPSVYEKSRIIKGFLDLNHTLSPAARFETDGIILQLLSRFLTNETSAMVQHPTSLKIQETIFYIEANLKKNLTVELLAKRVNQSADHFSDQFLKKTGQRPLAYILHKRVERAQFLLVTSNMPLSVIATETGFQSLSYFTRMFKKIAGVTPGRYLNSQSHTI